MNPLRKWWEEASPEDKKQLAAKVHTSVDSLRLAVYAYRTSGRISLSAELAGRIADNVPGVSRRDLCDACAGCPHSQAASKNR